MLKYKNTIKGQPGHAAVFACLSLKKLSAITLFYQSMLIEFPFLIYNDSYCFNFLSKIRSLILGSECGL